MTVTRTNIIQNEVAYENAIKRNIMANAQKTFRATFPRADEVVDFLYVQAHRPNPFELWSSFFAAYNTYGKLTEKQYACVVKAIDKAQEARKSNSVHVGTVGAKVEMNLTVEHTFQLNGYYGITTVYLMKDEQGNRVVYKTSTNEWANKKAIIQVKGTVKEHSEYKGEKQTVITRAKVLKVLKDEVAEQQEQAQKEYEIEQENNRIAAEKKAADYAALVSKVGIDFTQEYNVKTNQYAYSDVSEWDCKFSNPDATDAEIIAVVRTNGESGYGRLRWSNGRNVVSINRETMMVRMSESVSICD